MKQLLVLFAIILLSFFFRMYGLNWDQNHHLHPDERFLTMVVNAIKWPASFSDYLDTNNSSLNPHNAGFGFFVYGTFPLFLVKWLAGLLKMDTYDGVTLVGRAVSALFDVGTVIVTYVIAKELFGLGRSGRTFFHHFNGNHRQRDSNQNQSGRYLSTGHDLPDINSIHNVILSNLTARSVKNIPNSIDKIKVRILSAFKLTDRLRDIRIKPSQPAAKLLQTDDNTRNQAVLSFFRSERINTSIPLLAAFFYAISVLPIQLSHFFAVDTFLTFFITLSFYFVLQIITVPKKKNALAAYYILHTALLGISFGLAIASKISALLFLPIIGLGFLNQMYQVVWPRRFRLLGYWVIGLLVFIFTCYLTVRLTQPYLFTDNSLISFHLNPKVLANWKELKSFENPNGWFPPGIQWIHTKPYIFPLKNMVFWGLGLPLGILAFLSIPYGIYVLIKRLLKEQFIAIRDSQFVILFLCILWVLFLFIYQGGQLSKPMRYFLPIYPFLSILAAYCIVHFSRRIGLLGYWVIGLFILIYPIAFLPIYSHPHSRIAASEWIYANIPPGAVLSSEHWDDGLPLSLPSGPNYPYRHVEFPLYHPDTEEKWIEMKNKLAEVDYIILSSNRLYGSLTTVPKRYPLTNRFYQMLFDGSLGFEKVAEFTSRPNIPLPGITFCITPPGARYGIIAKQVEECPLSGISMVDDYADETFTVYDHPKVIILKKIAPNDYYGLPKYPIKNGT